MIQTTIIMMTTTTIIIIVMMMILISVVSQMYKLKKGKKKGEIRGRRRIGKNCGG